MPMRERELAEPVFDLRQPEHFLLGDQYFNQLR
jgi:hypothetical protein